MPDPENTDNLQAIEDAVARGMARALKEDREAQAELDRQRKEAESKRRRPVNPFVAILGGQK